MPYCVLPLSVLQYIAVLQYVVRLIKEHIMSLKLAKKLSRNVKLYCIFLVQSLLQYIAIFQYVIRLIKEHIMS